MKQYFIIFILCLFVILNIKESFSYQDKRVIKPVEVTSKNLSEYAKSLPYEIIYFCSYDKCYQKKEKEMNMAVNNFKAMYDKTLSEEDKIMIDAKGYPITEIGY